MKAFQDYYPDELAQCYGCGRLNAEGHHLQSFWDGEETTARFIPKPYHLAVPGFVNGGVLASLVDCHATGTAAAAAGRAAGVEVGGGPLPRFVTASLRVDFLRPTPLGPELTVRGRTRSVSERKVVVNVTIAAAGQVTVQGEVVCVKLPESMRPPGAPAPPSSTGAPPRSVGGAPAPGSQAGRKDGLGARGALDGIPGRPRGPSAGRRGFGVNTR